MENRTAGVLLAITILAVVTVTGCMVINALDKKRPNVPASPQKGSEERKISDSTIKAKEGDNIETQASVAIYEYIQAMNEKNYKDAYACIDPEYAKQNGITEKNLKDFEAGWFPEEMSLYMKAVLVKNNQIRCKISLQQVSSEAVGDNDLIEYPREIVLVETKDGLKLRLMNK